MFEFKENIKHFRIPETVTLEDIIEILNKMGLTVQLDDSNNKEWIYEHKDWFIEDT